VPKRKYLLFSRPYKQNARSIRIPYQFPDQDIEILSIRTLVKEFDNNPLLMKD
jgi:hypothetical protein